jgi:hypothetical protein
MSQLSLITGTSAEFLENFPKSGIMLSNGTSFRLPMLDVYTEEIESGLSQGMYPTPCANNRPNEGNVRLLRNKVMTGELSREEAKAMLNGKDPFAAQGTIPEIQYPTPTASDIEWGVAKDVQMENGSFFRENKKGVRWGVKLRDAVNHLETKEDCLGESKEKARLNPEFVEFLMAYPIGHTELDV